MLRIAVAAVIALHGVVHLIGFVVPWRLASLEGFPYTTTAAWGRIELGEGGARLLGVSWLIAAIVFFVAAFGIWQQAPWALPLLAIVAAGSLVLCVLGSPAAVAGIAINVAILAVIGYVALRPS